MHALLTGQPADRVDTIAVLSDNYVFVLHDGQLAAVVDPGVAGPVIRWLQARQLELVAVLHTHHHADHIGGTPSLLRRWPGAAVVAARADRQRIPLQTHGVAHGDHFELLGRRVDVLEVPGHTRAHIAFYLPPLAGEPGHLFCGDTLFAGGCGRLFEGSPEQMVTSLQQLAALPPATLVWCAHEYTETNLRWAANQRPSDTAITDRLADVLKARSEGRFTIPSTIALERATNLFVQARDPGELGRLRENRNRWIG